MSAGHTYESLLDSINGLEILDTHEHLPGSEKQRNPNADILQEYLIHYFVCDLISAGLTHAQLKEIADTSKPLPERWKKVEPYWELARNTGYGRALDETVKGIYGIDRIDGNTIEELNRRFRKALEEGGHYRTVLKEKSRIRLSIVDSNLECDREFFRSTFRADGFIMVAKHSDLFQYGEGVGMAVHTLSDWRETLARQLDHAIEKGAVCVKVGVAYLRPLRFDKVSTSEAEAAFHTLFNNEHLADWHVPGYPGKALQDYTMHALCALCEQRNFPIQIHTGLQEGNGNFIANSDPTLLNNLFLEYTGTRFDLFHIGYPYQQMLSALVKNCRNVFIDMCWAHIISPEACVRSLVEWLDAMPINKISAFGGDYCFVDGVYGHQKLARENVARALTEKVERGVFGMDRAREIAHRLFIDNPAELFGLK